jgi:hypothetical protein
VALAVGLVATVSLGGVAFALAITLSAPGGPAGSAYTAEVPCAVEPEVKVRSLDVSPPAATLVPLPGVEAQPGLWVFDLQAGARDQLIGASCNGESAQARFDVEQPALLPGPTVNNFGAWRPQLDRTTVVGTDCPAGTQATVTLVGTGGATVTTTASIDAYGDWEVPIPAAIPAGTVTITASCGAVTYAPISFQRQGGTVPQPSGSQPPPTGSQPPPTGSEPPPTGAPTPTTPRPAPGASPVAGRPTFTG